MVRRYHIDLYATAAKMRLLQRKTQETIQDRKSRDAEALPLAERLLPQRIASRFTFPFKDNLSSYLGEHNPLAETADPAKDTVWLFDNTAYRPVHFYPHAPQPWQAEFVAAYFVKDSGKDVSKWVADIADKIGLGKKGEDREEGEKVIAQRLTLFAQTIQPARSVNVKFPDAGMRKLGPGSRNAISSQIVGVEGSFKNGDSVGIGAVPREVAPYGEMITRFAEPEGWAVISGYYTQVNKRLQATLLTYHSDIDDSIKITLTPSPLGLLSSTFVSTPTPISGMPELYAHIHKLLSPTWFYLSASPYNLYPFLRTFLHAHYPPGTLILRDASFQNLSFSGFLLASLTQGTEQYKNSRVEKIHTWLPRRKVLCVGDSTQSDPEVYGDMWRRFGSAWIRKIFIRKVVGVAGMEEGGEKNGEGRFEKAFRGVPREVWRVFEDPAELEGEVEALVGM